MPLTEPSKATMPSLTHSRSQSLQHDIRLEDFLDDKLQSTTDLENLDSLIANVELQRSQLQAQLDDATQALEGVRRSAHDRQGGLSKQVEEFWQLQHSIDARQRVMNASTDPQEAIQRLERPMKQRHRVELAYHYVSLLKDVESMRLEAKTHLPKRPKDALKPYTRLKRLSVRLRELQRPADEAAAHLVAYVERITDSLWEEMKKIMSEEMDTILKNRKWPQGADPASEMDSEWFECFEKLLDLQIPEVLSSEKPVTLLPIDVMAKPFVQWFKFQFMGNSATSSPQAFSTFCLPNFVSLIEKWEGFFRTNMGHPLDSRFRDTKAANDPIYVDPACALITSLLPVLRQKVDSVVQYGLSHPQYLSSLVVQLMNFDDTIRSRFDYDGDSLENGWDGLASEVLKTHFDVWLKAEQEFALERYHAIMASPEAHKIDFDYSVAGKTKPTYGAVRIMDLLKTITAQYERVRTVGHKWKFFEEIQLEILDRFHNHLRDSLIAYQAKTSTVARTLQGTTKEELAALEGTGAFETLCKVSGSCDHIISTLQEWGEDEFFVSFWEQVRQRLGRSDDQTNAASGMTYDHVKERTSSEIDSENDGTIFDETIKAYKYRRADAIEYLVVALAKSHYDVFRPYLSKPQWTIVSAELAELAEPLRIMKRNLTFLDSVLSTLVLRSVWRETLDGLQDMLWTGILQKQHFTALGAAQFARDVDAIVTLVEQNLSEESMAMIQLQEGVRLLSLPKEADAGAMSLKDASDRIFTDNAEARKVLQELEIDTLDPPSARRILQRRVDNE